MTIEISALDNFSKIIFFPPGRRPSPIHLEKGSEKALKKGLNMDNGLFYKNESFSSNGLRMGFASLEENEMARAPGILKKVLE